MTTPDFSDPAFRLLIRKKIESRPTWEDVDRLIGEGEIRRSNPGYLCTGKGFETLKFFAKGISMDKKSGLIRVTTHPRRPSPSR